MTILLTGARGQLGFELRRSLLPLGTVHALDRSQGDLSNLDWLRGVVRRIRPDVIVNAAAYTAVDRAESEEELAFGINGQVPAVLAEEAARLGALLVHYSTDYVYDGAASSPYREDAAANPKSAYGRSKLAGDEAILKSGCRGIILRTSWVYGTRGSNFLRTMLRLAAERHELRVVADQHGSPTWSRWLAEATAAILCRLENRRDAETGGVYHLSASGETTWHGFAEAILEEAECIPNLHLQARTVVPIRTEDYPTPAARPRYSVLSQARVEREFAIAVPNWREQLRLCMEELLVQ